MHCSAGSTPPPSSKVLSDGWAFLLTPRSDYPTSGRADDLIWSELSIIGRGVLGRISLDEDETVERSS